MKKWTRWIGCALCAAGLSAGAANIVKNGGFETLDATGTFPEQWGRHWVFTGTYEAVSDIASAHSGTVALKVDQRAEGASDIQTTLGSPRYPGSGGGSYTLSVWAKGDGEVAMMTYLYGAGKYLEPEQPLVSASFPTAPDTWQKYTFAFTIPDSGSAIHLDHSVIRVDEFEVLFNVKGTVWLDDVELYPAGKEPKEQAAFAFDPALPPLLTLPRLPQAPVIDGKVEAAEWARAAATTGFRSLELNLADRQTVVYAGYDAENMYFAFSSRQETLLLGMGAESHFSSADFNDRTEGLELWLAPHGDGWFQLLMVPGGGWTCSSSTGDMTWANQAVYRASVQESTTMSGGIMTMDAKTWFGEVAIPFAALGAAAPQTGSEWRANFCRDFSTADGSARQGRDWTVWAPVRSGFAAVPEYGILRFQPDAPAVQLLRLGDPERGKLSLGGNTSGAAQLQAKVVVPRFDDKAVLAASEAAGGAGELALAGDIRSSSDGVTPMRLEYAVCDAENRLLAQAALPFTLMPTFWIKPQLFFTAGQMQVTADFSRMSLPEQAQIVFSVTTPAQDRMAEETVAIAGSEHLKSVTFDISDWKPGIYRFTGEIADAAGQVLAATTEECDIPAPPVWWHTALWNDRSVPSPFVPIRSEGQSTEVLLRSFQWQNNGLPQTVAVEGQPLLAAPAALVLEVDGRPEAWEFAALKPLEKADDLVRWAIAGESASFRLAGELSVEFDGFARWNVTVTPKRPEAKITRLALEFPVRGEEALFLRGDGFTGSLLQDIYTGSPRESKLVHLGNSDNPWGTWMYDASGWHWNERFFYELVLGSDRRAFCVMSETDEYIRGPRYASVREENGVTTLAVDLVSEATAVDEALHYDYFFQTLPVKAEPQDPKKWHIGLDPGSIYNVDLEGYTSPAGTELLDSLAVGQVYYDLLPDGYPVWVEDAATSRDALQRLQAHGLKIAHNLWYAAAPDHMPEYRTFGAEWDAFPTFFWTTPHARMTATCLNSSYADFHLHNVEKIVNELGLDGFYTDATAIPCSNGRHGCGYLDSDGVRKPTLNLLATRRFVKQMYRILKSEGRDRINFSHSGESPASAAFVDVRTHGEELVWEGLNHYRRLTPDYFRAKYAQNEYGIPYTFFAVFHYSWRKVGDAVPTREILMMTLPHRVSFPLTYELEVLPVWRIVDPWWTAEFHPYWRSDCPVTSAKPTEVLTSAFVRPEQRDALVAVSNWSYEPQAAEIRIDPAKLGFAVDAVYVVDTATGERKRLDDAGLRALPLAARDFALLEIQGAR